MLGWKDRPKPSETILQHIYLGIIRDPLCVKMANVLPLDNEYWHEATEAYAEGIYAQIYSIALVLIPAAWLAIAAYKNSGGLNAAGSRA